MNIIILSILYGLLFFSIAMGFGSITYSVYDQWGRTNKQRYLVFFIIFSLVLLTALIGLVMQLTNNVVLMTESSFPFEIVR